MAQLGREILGGKTIAAAARATGLDYAVVWRHLHGQRRPKGETALLYERALGIPRSVLRPDLWPPTDTDTNSNDSEPAATAPILDDAQQGGEVQ